MQEVFSIVLKIWSILLTMFQETCESCCYDAPEVIFSIWVVMLLFVSWIILLHTFKKVGCLTLFEMFLFIFDKCY